MNSAPQTVPQYHMDIHHAKVLRRSFARFFFFFFFFLQKLLLTGRNVLMNEALIQCELLTALETWGTNSFAALVRYVEISPSDVPDT